MIQLPPEKGGAIIILGEPRRTARILKRVADCLKGVASTAVGEQVGLDGLDAEKEPEGN
jgi:hypothetical protein